MTSCPLQRLTSIEDCFALGRTQRLDMGRLCLCGVFAAVLLSGCRRQDISGTYLVIELE